MKKTDIDNIATLMESHYRNIETMQSSSKVGGVTDLKRDPAHSTPQWDGMVDPTRGNMLNSFSIDEEQPDIKSKLKNIIQKEIDVAPKKMSYTKRVLKKLLTVLDSL